MAKFVGFGELMVRLSPCNYERFVQADRLEFDFGGAEANTAVSLANYGMNAAFVTKLPSHAIGQAVVNSLRRYGVDTSYIVRGGDRVGIYFIEKGASQRAGVCIYDRKHSAIAEAEPEDFDWDKIFSGTDWFHFTGITPALSPNAAVICEEACKAAKAHGAVISCDLNYRSTLWLKAEAQKVMEPLLHYVDVAIFGKEDPREFFGIEDNTQTAAAKLADRFGFSKVAITLRENISASDNDWSAMLYDGKQWCFSKCYHLHIVDRIGGGDGFTGGLIYALLNGYDSQNAVEFGAAAAALKHSIEGDYNMVSADEVLSLANGDGSGRVRR